MNTKGAGAEGARPLCGAAKGRPSYFCTFLIVSVLFPHFSGTFCVFPVFPRHFFCTFLILFRHIPGNSDFVLFPHFFDTFDFLQDLWAVAVTGHHNRWIVFLFDACPLA